MIYRADLWGFPNRGIGKKSNYPLKLQWCKHHRNNLTLRHPVIPPEIQCFRYVFGVQIPSQDSQEVLGCLGDVYIYIYTVYISLIWYASKFTSSFSFSKFRNFKLLTIILGMGSWWMVSCLDGWSLVPCRSQGKLNYLARVLLLRVANRIVKLNHSVCLHIDFL